MDKCLACNRELETVTEENPCCNCAYIHVQLQNNEELDFNQDQPREYEPEYGVSNEV